VFASNQEFIGTVDSKTDAAGAFALGALPPGTYFVRAQPAPALLHQPRFYNSKLDVATATPITLGAANDVTGINMFLPAGGNLAGTLHRAGDPTSPLSGIDLDVYDSTWHFLSNFNGKSDTNGLYAVGSMAPGGYYIRAQPTPADRHVTTYWP